jgi:hypothetical protein
LGRARPRSLSWNAVRDAQEGRGLVPGCEAARKQTKRSVQNVTDADFNKARHQCHRRRARRRTRARTHGLVMVDTFAASSPEGGSLHNRKICDSAKSCLCAIASAVYSQYGTVTVESIA